MASNFGNGRRTPVEHFAPTSAQVEELKLCARDPIYFANKYCKIKHPHRGTIPLKTYPFQDKCLRSFQKHRFNIILKSRQLGLSTISAAYAVWMALFKRDKNILVIATKLSTAKNFIIKVVKILDSLPPWMRICDYEKNQQEVRFENGSQIKAVPTTEDAGRSEALSLLIIDEAAFVRNFEEIWAALFPTLSEGGGAIVLSTPNGVGGQYYDLWIGSETEGLGDDAVGDNGFHPIRLPWDVHPEHDEEYFETTSKKLGPRKTAQELLCVATGTKVVTPEGYTRVQDLKPGDLVLTHKGRFKPVEKVASRVVQPDERLYSISSPGNRLDPIVATGNHPLLGYRYWDNHVRNLDYLVQNEPLLTQSWIPVEDCAAKRKITDKIVNVLFPKLDKSLLEKKHDRVDLSELYPSVEVTETTCRYEYQWGSTRRFVDIDFELGKFIGLYLAEGCQGHLGGLDMAFHTDEMTTHAKWCLDYLERHNCRASLEKHKVHNSCRVWTFNKHFGALVRSFVKGRTAPEKQLDMDLVMSCGFDFVKGLLYGHHLGDGDHKHTKKTKVVSASEKLLYQLRTLGSVFGLYPRIGSTSYTRDSGYQVWFGYLEYQAEGVTFLDLLNRGQQFKKQSRTRLVHDAFVGRHTFDDVTFLAKNNDYIVWDIKVADDASFVAGSVVFHNCDFLSSGETFLKSATVNWINQEQRAPISREGPEGSVWIWKAPEKGHKYVIGADVARGDAKDNTTFVCIDMTIGEIVAEYQGKIYPDGLAEILDQYGRMYNNALVAVEANTFGNHTLIDLRKLSYPNIFYRTAPAHSIEMHYPQPKDKAGFDTQTASRMEALVRFEDSMRCHVVTPRSARFHEEVQSFVWLDEKPQAKKNKHDDLIMATAIACWVYRTHFENYRLACKANGGAQGSQKPLFAYMSKSTKSFYSGYKPTHPFAKGPQQPKPAGLPQNVELSLEELKWLL